MSEVVATPAVADSSTPATDGAPAGIDPSSGKLPTKGESAAAPTPPPPAPKLKLRGKVDGQEVEEEISQEELHAKWQKMKAADKRLAEASEKEKAREAREAKFKQDPWAHAKELGIDLRELAIQKLAEEFKAEELKKNDPAAFERQELQKQLEAERARIKEYEDTRAAQEHETLVQSTQQEILQGYGTALQKLGMPITEEVAHKMLEIGMLNIEHGVDLTPEHLAQETKEYFEGLDTRASKSVEEKFKARYASLDGEDLLKAIDGLSDGMVKKLQGALLARARSAISRPPAPVQKVEADPGEQGRKQYKDQADVMKRMGVIG